MNRRMLKNSLLLGLGFSLCLGLGMTSIASVETDISGTYKCIGNEPFQKATYQSDLTITKLGDTFSFRWGQSGKDFGGTGIFSKGSSNIIAAEFWSPANNNNSGVIIYQIQPDNSLDGTWAIADQGLVGTETCKKNP